MLAAVGVLQAAPMFSEWVLSEGVADAAMAIGWMFLSLGPLFFVFQIQTRAFHFARTILAGGAKYCATGN